jgi:hypothetical protein
MRHTLLCSLVAFLAAIFSFVLTPIIVLLVLQVASPWAFHDDTLTWVLVLAGPLLLAVLVSISVIAGIVAFAVAKARLPDRGWLSAPTFGVVLPLAAIVLGAGAVAWRIHATTDPPEAVPRQTGLPSLRLARTLMASDRKPHNWRLSWSGDGERLVTYAGAGVLSVSPDGEDQKEFPLRTFPYENVIHYLSGHRLLITQPGVGGRTLGRRTVSSGWRSRSSTSRRERFSMTYPAPILKASRRTTSPLMWRSPPTSASSQ